MSEFLDLGLSDTERRTRNLRDQQARAVGSPLPVGGVGRQQAAPEEEDVQPSRTAPPPGRSLLNPAPGSSHQSGIDRAMSAVRMAIPLVQRILPLLDGNLATTVANLLAPQPQTHPPQAPVNLEPIENGLIDLKSQHRDLRVQIVEQNSSLKRVEDQLEMVREATDRNTLEQQELMEDLKTVGNKVNMVAVIALGLLAVSIVLNVLLYLHLNRVLP